MRSLQYLFVLGLSSLLACATETTDDAPGEDDPGVTEGAWDAESADHEDASTHLWIVNRGIDILAKHSDDPVAKRMVSIMNDASCRKQWQQGLLDADFKAAYNNGTRDMAPGANDAQVALAQASWKSHFFDPDTGKNYKGETSPTAYTESNGHFKNALESKLETKAASACYELGLTLHYYTDLTQPMHASNFTAVDRPLKLHSNLEGYAVTIQARYPLADWTGKPTGSVKDYVMQTAKDSKPLFLEGVTAVVAAYKAYTGWHILTCRNIDAEAWRFVERQHVDYSYCWSGNAGVDAQIGKTLISAQDHTAKMIYLMGTNLPADPNATPATPEETPAVQP